MSRERLIGISERWFRLLLRLYPADFRDEMGDAVVEAYRDRARETLNRGGVIRLAGAWVQVLAKLAAQWPGGAGTARGGVAAKRQLGRDMELATRRRMREPAFAAAMVGTLTVGLGMFAVVYTVVEKILIEPMPYRNPDDLYFVWRDYGPMVDLKRGWLGGPDVAELQKAGGIIEGAVGLQRELKTFSAREDTDPSEIAVMATSPTCSSCSAWGPHGVGCLRGAKVGPGRPPVIVLTHELWIRLGADPGSWARTCG